MVKEYIRPYELSIWTLQDEFITVLKWSEIENRGQIQNGELELVDDGTEKLSFSIPLWYYDNGVKIKNPLWVDVNNNSIIPNMHKLKLIFNKKTPEEGVFEFLITSIDESHDKDEVIYDINCEGLAFHELGKIGYKVSLNGDDFLADWENWFKYGQLNDAPVQNIQYWNDRVFKYTDVDGNIKWKYNWEYEVHMDWSSFSFSGERDPEKVYEEEYVSSWDSTDDFLTYPKQVEGFREKWRPVEVEESNIYNITQTIAETFGVFCKYKYEYDENYHIIKRKVIYYNNFIEDSYGHIDLTYPYQSSSITRSLDNSETITKLFVRPVDSNTSEENITTIMNVEANRSREDYLLNFDYLHDMKTITDEQYAEVKKYEDVMRMYNNQLLKLEQQIQVLQNSCITEEANITLYTNAINLDNERYNNAKALREQLTGNDTWIRVTDATPEMLLLKKDSSQDNTYYVTISLEGVQPNTVALYKNIDYTQIPGSSLRLTGRYTGGKFEYDEFGNLNRISNIYITDQQIKRLYMTCSYRPTLYYDNVERTWELRRYKDTQSLEAAKQRLLEYRLLLTGGDVDYARVDYTLTDYAVAANGAMVDECKVDYARLDEGHGYLATYNSILRDKQEKIIEFEKLMGPALREGYWQPDTYNDYGDKYLDSFEVDFTRNTINGSTKFATFIWDTEAFDEETTLFYEVGAQKDTEYYLLVDLTNCLEQIKGNLNNLSFIYYDENITTIEELDRARRSFTINSLCEFGYVYHKTKQKYIPVLVITGSSSLPSTQLNFIKTNQDYKPFLGTLESEYDTATQTINTVAVHLCDNLNFIEPTDVKVNKNDKPCLCYPRIRISSLQMKNSEDELLVSSNGQNLNMFEDFYVLIRTDQSNIDDSYYVTIKPKYLIKNGIQNTILGLSYALSNADISIYLDAIQVMKENSTPKVSYSITLSTLNKDFIHTAYNKLNRIVHINDAELAFHDINGYISSVQLKLDKPDEDTVEIKNYATKFEDLFTTIVAQTEAMKKNFNIISLASQVIGSNGLLSASVLQESMLKVDLNYAFNQGKLTIDEQNGIWGVSDAGVVAFRGGGIFTATEKDENGQWRWNTGILPSGINADLITSGQLDTNKIKIYAGDKVKFQLNGDGLFAYKSLFSDGVISDTSAALNYIKNKTGSSDPTIANIDIDASQYVTFNEDGLFLIAKKGTLVLNEKKNGFITVGENSNSNITEVKRVEISWQGLKLRNWKADEVFYADPDSGDLTLDGRVFADSGRIGGWDLTDKSLTGNFMQIVNDKNDINHSGIFLTDNTITSASTINYNGLTLYAYTLNGSGEVYYYAGQESSHVITSNDTIYGYGTRVQSVIPKYTARKTITETYTTGSNATGADTGTEVAGTLGPATTTGSTTYSYEVVYVTTSQNNVNAAIKYNNKPIEYDGSNNPNATWYSQIKAALPNTYRDYVEITEVPTSSIEQINGLSGTLTLATYTPKLELYANGNVIIQKGTLGSFTLTSTELLNGTFRNTVLTGSTITNSSIKIGNAVYATNDYGQLFKDFSANSGAGQFTLTRVNGSAVTFNIADTTYFRSAVSAARVITLGLSYSNSGLNSYATATATTPGFGDVPGYTATATVNLAPIYRSGVSKGTKDVTIKTLTLTNGGVGSGYGDHTIKVEATAIASNGARKGATDYINVHQTYKNGVFVGSANTYASSFSANGSYSTSMSSATAGSLPVAVTLNCNSEGAAPAHDSTGTLNATNVWKSGYYAASQKVSYSGSTKDITAGNSYTLTVPSGTNSTRSITFRAKAKSNNTCLVAGTPIQLADGSTMPIEALTLGTQVLSYDSKKKIYVPGEIINTQMYKHASDIVDIYLSSGAIITATKSHPFLLSDGSWRAVDPEKAKIEWVDMDDVQLLEAGQELVSITNNKIYIIKIEERPDLSDTVVYNCTVENYHNYVVHDIVVHNRKTE